LQAERQWPEDFSLEGNSVRLELSNARVLKSAQRRYDAQMPVEDAENPECRDCAMTMEGEDDGFAWHFTCPKCGYTDSGDRAPDEDYLK
jgi:rubrerythrin